MLRFCEVLYIIQSATISREMNVVYVCLWCIIIWFKRIFSDKSLINAFSYIFYSWKRKLFVLPLQYVYQIKKIIVVLVERQWINFVYQYFFLNNSLTQSPLIALIWVKLFRKKRTGVTRGFCTFWSIHVPFTVGFKQTQNQ